MRICIISEYFYPDDTGGTGTVLSHLAHHLKDHYADLQIDVLTSKNLYRGESAHLPKTENWKGIRIFRLQTPKSNRASSILRLAAGLLFTIATFGKLMRQKPYDLVLVVTNPPTLPIAAKLYNRWRHVPYLYLIHDLYPDVAVALQVLSNQSKIAHIFSSMQRQWLHHADKVIVLGRCMQDYLTAHYQLPAEQIEVITNWADADSIQPMSQNTQFRKQHGISGFVVLYAGNFGQYQDFNGILDAAKVLLPNSHITFVFVGDGARKEAIAQRIYNDGLSNVRMLPFVPRDQFSDMLASADLSLVTLEPGAEGLGVPSKFYNILASGRATLALVSPNCEVARVVQEADCGMVIAQNDVIALSLTIEKLSHSPEKVRQMGINARHIFEEKYTLPRIAEQFHQEFKSIFP